MTTKPAGDKDQREDQPADATIERDVDGHALPLTEFHRTIATSRVRESVEGERPGHPRKTTRNQPKGRNGR
jgi:hypothetical protein